MAGTSAAVGWQDRHWQASETDSEDEEQLVEVLPDIKGWLLLEKAGMDTLEKRVIQSDIKSQFTLLNVENVKGAQPNSNLGDCRGMCVC